LDLDTAFGGSHENATPGGTVHNRARVQPRGDSSTGLNRALRNRLTTGVGLIGHQTPAPPVLGEGLGIFPALDQLHTTGLAAATSVNLSLDHPLGTANGVTGLGSCFRSVDSDALGDRKAVFSKQLLPLIFVKVHS